ncbi:expressed unknown protein [Seminavis robusta]|uniref:Uncharacterized protein n=1 Tax=Seminavis robusta TaxID=568900 RepID=A0A9N8EV95_9STRA|nr:expressed unknown protein [Seminavis robusta]|eukprot:Sro1791_g297780.1 n/a (131) ;mRNA; f:3757-4149
MRNSISTNDLMDDWSQDISSVVESSESWSEDISAVVARSSLRSSVNVSPQANDDYSMRIARRAERRRKKHAESQEKQLNKRRSCTDILQAAMEARKASKPSTGSASNATWSKRSTSRDSLSQKLKALAQL